MKVFIKEAILDNTATQDSFTGNTVNNTWGHGKIDAWLSTFLIEQSLSTDEKETIQTVKIYPNPTSDFITIKTALEYSNVELFNTLGKKIKDFNVTTEGKEFSIDLKGLKSGIYFLSLTNGFTHDIFKVVKN